MHRTAGVLILLLAACDDGADSARIAAPERQFALEGLSLSDRRPDGSVWQGRAAGALGDTSNVEVEKLELEVTTAGSAPRTFVIRAPRGSLAFDTRTGTFPAVVVDDRAGATLEAGDTRYDGATEQVDAAGPLLFRSPELVVRGSSGTATLNDGTIVVRGPVTGRYEPPSAQPTPSGRSNPSDRLRRSDSEVAGQ